MTTSAPSVDDQHELLSWLDQREARYEVIDGVVLVSHRTASRTPTG